MCSYSSLCSKRCLNFRYRAQEKQDVITPQTETTFAYLRSGALDHFLNHLQTFSSIGFFFLVWAGNILLLRQNVHRIGKTKFWVLMSAPLIAWSLFYLLFYQSILDYLPGEDVFAGIVLPVLVMMSSQIVALVLLGATFGSIAKALNFAPIIRDYMMITAYGFILFFYCHLGNYIRGRLSTIRDCKRNIAWPIFLPNIHWSLSVCYLCRRRYAITSIDKNSSKERGKVIGRGSHH